MFNNFFEIFSSNIATGGLFDFNATLPFIAIQFLILMFVLNNILYNPLLSIIKERDESIESVLIQGAQLIDKIGEVKHIYDNKILDFSKSAQDTVTSCKKELIEITDDKLNKTQENFTIVLENLDLRLAQGKNDALIKLEDESQIKEIGALIKQKIILAE